MHRNLTVKETLKYYAWLKKDSRSTYNDANALVDRVLLAMNLVEVRHSLIGDENKRGVSGGQRKRVNGEYSVYGVYGVSGSTVSTVCMVCMV
jgi:ABC-type multidrug transport system ATPase subunit